MLSSRPIFVSECFEDREYKDVLLAGLKQSLPAEKIFGGATYGSFTQEGCTDFDAVCLWGIGGPGIDVATSLVTEMGTSKLSFDENEQLIKEKLHAAGQKLVDGLKQSNDDRLLVVFGDAHSPKVQYLVEGVQKTLGPKFPITGGCANKNAGQTFTYYKGDVYEDAAIALMLSGDFGVTQSGRQANECETVIRSAKEGAQEALDKAMNKTPIFVTAFNCAGRRSKLDKYETELEAIQAAIGELPMFGCYNAGEIGPVDDPDWPKTVTCGGSGWHVMYTIICR